MPGWVERLCAIAVTRKTSAVSLKQLFEEAAPDLSDRSAFLAAVSGWLRQNPDLVDEWATYCADRRSSPAPYFLLGDRRSVVGFYDDGYGDVVKHETAAGACADYIYRETCWVMYRRRSQ